LDMLAIQTRLYTLLSGPRIGKAKTTGFVEGDFWGHTEETINAFRLRQAFFRLDWSKTSLWMGQTWNPIFIEFCFPETVSFNIGSPFESISRNPQIRVEQKISEEWKFIACAATELDFRSTGTFGFSTIYLRNSKVPLCHGQLQWTNGDHMFGVGVDVRSLKPRLVSDKNFKVDERITSVSAIAYGKGMWDAFKIKIKFIFGSNAVGYEMIGGYGITSVDPTTDKRTYTNIRNVSIWTDMSGRKSLQPGLFVGFTKNIGAAHCLVPLDAIPGIKNFDELIFGRGKNIDWAFRISPRLVWIYKSIQLAAELEVTHAAFGTVTQKGTVHARDPETNVRCLAAAYYVF